MKVVVLGAGYVGVVTGVGLAAQGHDVVCVDVDESKLARLRDGRAPFFEPGLEPLLQAVVGSGRFRTSRELSEALPGADVSIVAVGTPSTGDGIDLSQVRAASRDIARRLPALGRYHVVAIKSTVVPTTTDTVVRETLEQTSGLTAGPDFGLAMNPEFLREGQAVEDFTNPDRIVIGALDDRSAGVIRNLYRGFDCPVIVTSLRNAEMIKYSANALLATLISFANEISTLCEHVEGLSEETVARGVLEDRRFWLPDSEGGRRQPGLLSYLRGGVGFGGSCFPKDVKALQQFAKGHAVATPMLGATLAINDDRAGAIVRRIEALVGDRLEGRRVAVLGLAFKPDTDDTRESPGLRIAHALARRGAVVVCHDPLVDADRVAADQGLELEKAGTIEAALYDCAAAIITTAWPDYRAASWPELTRVMRRRILLDGRQVVPPEQRGRGFAYASTGTAEIIGESGA